MTDDKQPEMWVFGGPNGSGKSTITKEYQEDYEDFPSLYINADDIKVAGAGKFSDLQAAQKADNDRRQAIKDRVSFAFETVFSMPDKVDIMKEAKDVGYIVRFFYVCTQDAGINVERVAKRVAKGGHDVPEDKVRARYKRSMELLSKAIPIVDTASIYNNSFVKPILIAEKHQDENITVMPLQNTIPDSRWNQKEIENLLGLKKPQDLVNIMAARMQQIKQGK